MLNMPTPKELHVSADVFLKMKKLRVLKICDLRLFGCLTYLSNELIYFDWNGYPLRSLPSNFHPKNLVELHLPCSQIKQIWMGNTLLEKLKVLDLRDSLYLDRTPDFSGLPYLQELNLEGCTSLVEVHPSIGVHKMLISLNLIGCKNLRSLPRSIKLKRLRYFYLSRCLKLEKFPEIEGDMDCLLRLYLDGTGIKDLPSSIEHLNGLTSLYLWRCKKLECIPNNIWKLKSLEELYLTGCSKLKMFTDITQLLNSTQPSLIPTIWDQVHEMFTDISRKMKHLRVHNLRGSTAIKQLPSSVECQSNPEDLDMGGCIGPSSKTLEISPSLPEKKIPGSTYLKREFHLGLCSLRILDLSYCNLLEGLIPNSIGCLSSLTDLFLRGNKFASIPASIIQLTKLEKLILEYCSSLQILPSLPSSIQGLYARGCKSLEHYSIPPSIGSPDARRFEFNECHKLPFSSLSESQLQGIGWIELQGSEIPDWFSHRNEGSSIISLRLDPHSCSKLKGIAVCAIFGPQDEPYVVGLKLKVNGHRIPLYRLSFTKREDIKSDFVILVHRTCYQSFVEEIDEPIKTLTYKQRPHPGPPVYDWCSIEAESEALLVDEIPGPEPMKMGIHLVMEEQDEDPLMPKKTENEDPQTQPYYP